MNYKGANVPATNFTTVVSSRDFIRLSKANIPPRKLGIVNQVPDHGDIERSPTGRRMTHKDVLSAVSNLKRRRINQNTGEK